MQRYAARLGIEPATVVLFNAVLGHYASDFPYLEAGYVERYTAHARHEPTQIGKERLGDACNWRIEVEIGPVARAIVRHADRIGADL